MSTSETPIEMRILVVIVITAYGDVMGAVRFFQFFLPTRVIARFLVRRLPGRSAIGSFLLL